MKKKSSNQLLLIFLSGLLLYLLFVGYRESFQKIETTDTTKKIPEGNVLVDPETVYLSYIGGLRISSDRLNNVFVFTGSKWSSYNGYNQTVSTYKPL